MESEEGEEKLTGNSTGLSVWNGECSILCKIEGFMVDTELIASISGTSSESGRAR